MSHNIRILTLVAALTAGAASASGDSDAHPGTTYLPNGAFTYEVFETSVEHSDLEGCPAEFNTEEAFCRMTMAADMAHVFAFALEGEQVLLAVKSYELNDGFLPF